MASTRTKLDEIVESFSTLEDPPLTSIASIPSPASWSSPSWPSSPARRPHGHRPLGQVQGGTPHRHPRPAQRRPGKDVFRRVLMA